MSTPPELLLQHHPQDILEEFGASSRKSCNANASQSASNSYDPTEQSWQTSFLALVSRPHAAKHREISVISEETQQEDSDQLGYKLLALRFSSLAVSGSRASFNLCPKGTFYARLQIKATPILVKKQCSPAEHLCFPWNKELRQYKVFL